MCRNNIFILKLFPRPLIWLMAMILMLSWGAPVIAEPGQPRGADVLLAQATAGNREQILARLGNVKRLLEKSSGAQRVVASDNELSKKIRQHALDRYLDAEKAYQAADYETASQMLTEATKSMFQAIRILGPPKEIIEKKIADFEGRVESTRVLLGALQRIAEEEGNQGTAAKTMAAVEQSVTAARQMLDKGQYYNARRLLDGGYELAKAAVEGLRDGKTLVRTLNFANKQEEYRYELDRNDTHQMLVKVLLRKKSAGPQSKAIVDKFVQTAIDLRQQAEQQATGGEFSEAIRLLELSTRDLVRAIRGAGVYIPG